MNKANGKRGEGQAVWGIKIQAPGQTSYKPIGGHSQRDKGKVKAAVRQTKAKREYGTRGEPVKSLDDGRRLV